MNLVTPDIGQLFWATLIFMLLLVLLKKFAWKPILNAVKAREERIKGALESAEEVKLEMEKLKADNEEILKEARNERNKLLSEARDIKEKMITDAKTLANDEAKKIIETARLNIQSEKDAAISDLKKQVAFLSVDIAEKILQIKLKESKEQKQLIDKYLDKISIN